MFRLLWVLALLAPTPVPEVIEYVHALPAVFAAAAFGKGVNLASYSDACARAKELGARHTFSWNPNGPACMLTAEGNGLTFSPCYCDDFDIGQPLEHNSGVCHYLNEPEANGYSPQYAASRWAESVGYAAEYGCELAGPGMTSTNRTWLPTFLGLIPEGQRPRILNVHCYQGFEQCVETIEWLEGIAAQYGIDNYEIHLTEFSVRHCYWPDWAQQTADMVTYFEQHPRITRYYFFTDTFNPAWTDVSLPGCDTPAFWWQTTQITAQGWNYQHLPGGIVPYP